MVNHNAARIEIAGKGFEHNGGVLFSGGAEHIVVDGEVACGNTHAQGHVESGRYLTEETEHPIGRAKHSVCGNCAASYLANHGSTDETFEAMGELERYDWVELETEDGEILTGRVRHLSTDYPTRYVTLVLSGEPVERWAYGTEETVKARLTEGEELEEQDGERTFVRVERVEEPEDSPDKATAEIMEDLDEAVEDVDADFGEYGGVKATSPDPNVFNVSVKGEDVVAEVVTEVRKAGFSVVKIEWAEDREHSSYSSVVVEPPEGEGFEARTKGVLVTDGGEDVVPDVEVGDEVVVTWTGSYRGKTWESEGEVVEDPFMHRSTPEDAVDLKLTNEDGETYEARITEDGTLYGLHHATKRHDHRKGNVTDVEISNPVEPEDVELVNEFDTVDEAREAAEDVHEAVDAVAGKPHVTTHRLDEDAVDVGFAEGEISLRLITPNRRLSRETMAALVEHGAEAEYVGKSETWTGHEWLLWVPPTPDIWSAANEADKRLAREGKL